MKAFINILLLAAVIFGGGYYFARDIPMFAHFFPKSLQAEADDPIYLLYVNRLEHVNSTEKKVLSAFLAQYYMEVAEDKYNAIVANSEQFSHKQYLRMKRGEHEKCFSHYLDENKDGAVTQKEWKGTVFAFRSYDANKDDKISAGELWGNKGKKSLRKFIAADNNGDGVLSKEEYFASWGGFERAKDILKQTDMNGNGAVSKHEIRNATLFGNERCWQP